MPAKVASGDGQSGRSLQRRSVDRGLNGGLLFSDSWSCGLMMVLLEEEGGAQATRWPVAWGKQQWLSSTSGVAVVEANGEENRGEVEVEGEERGSSLAGRSS
jgi:hypothetical protein